MNMEFDTRLRRANLLPGDEQLEQLFDENMSLLLLRDVGDKIEGRRTTTRHGRVPPGEQPPTTGRRPTPPLVPDRRRAARRPGLGLALTGLLLIPAVTMAAVALVVVNSRQLAAPPTPIEIAQRFIEFRNAYDAETMMSLLAPDVLIVEDGPGFSVELAEDYPAQIALEQALGFRRNPGQCRETRATSRFTSSQVVCPYSVENEWSNALGVGPFTGSDFRFHVEDGEIREVVNFFDYSLYSWEAFEPFLGWVETYHPQAYENMWSASGKPILTPESISLWERYTDEFVVYVESGER